MDEDDESVILYDKIVCGSRLEDRAHALTDGAAEVRIGRSA